MGLGPFEIAPDQITRLGPRFTTFANKLLEVERSAQGLDGQQLSINANETAPDQGVDAAFRGSPGTAWVPAGDSAWQFKRSSQSAAECAAELDRATAAKAMLTAGGSYVIALGGDILPDVGVQARHEAIVAKAVELELIERDDAHSASELSVSSSLNLVPASPRSTSKVQPACLNSSPPPGASITPSSETYSVTTILPILIFLLAVGCRLDLSAQRDSSGYA